MALLRRFAAKVHVQTSLPTPGEEYQAESPWHDFDVFWGQLLPGGQWDVPRSSQRYLDAGWFQRIVDDCRLRQSEQVLDGFGLKLLDLPGLLDWFGCRPSPSPPNGAASSLAPCTVSRRGFGTCSLYDFSHPPLAVWLCGRHFSQFTD